MHTTHQHHRLQPGHSMSLHLPTGSELFCQQGILRLAIGPLAFAENHFSQIVHLPAGQTWRAPAGSWIQLSATLDQDASLQIHAAVQAPGQPIPSQAEQPASAPAHAGLMGWLAGLWQARVQRSARRGQSAA